MRIIAFDHFFSQDLDALEECLSDDDRIIRIPYRRWHRIARRHFPAYAFDGLAGAFDPDLSQCWVAYSTDVRRETEWICRAYSPHLLLLPSDSFFYVRPFIEQFRLHGIACFVMQKETTISPMVMTEHSAQIGQYVPFMSDYMAVCSERHKEFWIRAGTNPDLVEVTGQPRFDIYATTRRPTGHSKKSLLYLSYDDVAYLPTDIGSSFEGDWRELRLATEECIDAVSDSWDVIVKKHPQQKDGETRLGSRVKVADRFADTRGLILASDAVVGFQTTALYEAVVCGKPVIYPAWGDTFNRARESLIGFETVPGLVNWANSRSQLESLLASSPTELPAASVHGMQEALWHLGPVIGSASATVLDRMRRFAGTSSPIILAWRHYRERLLSVLLSMGLWSVYLAARLVRPDTATRIKRVADENTMVTREVLLSLRKANGRGQKPQDG